MLSNVAPTTIYTSVHRNSIRFGRGKKKRLPTKLKSPTKASFAVRSCTVKMKLVFQLIRFATSVS